jgi:SWI/SNF-related matrix-associated actin-dependent regulator of chromatin subfamily A member 5
MLGKDTGIGAVAAAVGAKWRQLSEEERSQYEELAADDRLRYDTEKEKKDEEYLLELEERHKKNAMVETDTRMRGSTLQQTDRITAESIDKKARVLTDKEKARLEEKRKAKSAESAVRHVQQEELKRAKAEQAEARLKYLLSQSDIFGHFGLKKKSPPADASGRPRGDRRVSSSEELDEDEKAMLEEEDEHEDGAPAGHENTILLQQPSWVSGGAMRSYQLEGLNWMIRLHENGINGILADEMGESLTDTDTVDT